MADNQLEGGIKDSAGKAEDAAGGITADSESQGSGEALQAEGQAQQAYGKAINQVRDFTTDNTVGSLLAAAGVGLVLGLIISRR